MQIFCRTDLAVEDYEREYKEQIKVFDYKDIKVEKVVVDENLSKKIHKKVGSYYTITMNTIILENHDEMDEITNILNGILKKLFVDMDINLNSKILVVGLGNEEITPDSLGPNVIKNIYVTNHLYELDKLEENLGIVSAIAPGVMGQTGMETSDIIKAITQKFKPDLILVIDALATRSLHRINRTIQITTAGINPGSGVGNKRKEISKSVLKTNVIAIGVPTVVDIASIFNDTIKLFNEIDDEDLLANYQEEKIRSTLLENNRNYMVTHKEIDESMHMFGDIISKAINNTVHNLEQYE